VVRPNDTEIPSLTRRLDCFSSVRVEVCTFGGAAVFKSTGGTSRVAIAPRASPYGEDHDDFRESRQRWTPREYVVGPGLHRARPSRR